jgi:hypothetical protein
VGTWRAVTLVVLLTAIAGCHHDSLVPLLGIGPVSTGAEVFDDAVRAARESGHSPIRTDPEHGRFAVRARADPSRQTVFIIQCSQDGYVTIVPEGGGVVRIGDAFRLTSPMRAEYGELAIALERAIPEER